MNEPSSLPPLKNKEGKYGLLALVFLLAAGALWFFLGSDEAEPQAEVVKPASEAPVREQFAPEIEIVDEEELEAATAEPSQPSPTRPANGDCTGALEAAQIREVINGLPRKQVQTCYERRLRDDNLLQGSMTVLLTIGTDGNVQAVSVDGSLQDNQVYSCVKRVARTWKFPVPQGGCVRTSVPFQMTPKL